MTIRRAFTRSNSYNNSLRRKLIFMSECTFPDDVVLMMRPGEIVQYLNIRGDSIVGQSESIKTFMKRVRRVVSWPLDVFTLAGDPLMRHYWSMMTDVIAQWYKTVGNTINEFFDELEKMQDGDVAGILVAVLSDLKSDLAQDLLSMEYYLQWLIQKVLGSFTLGELRLLHETIPRVFVNAINELDADDLDKYEMSLDTLLYLTSEGLWYPNKYSVTSVHAKPDLNELSRFLQKKGVKFSAPAIDQLMKFYERGDDPQVYVSAINKASDSYSHIGMSQLTSSIKNIDIARALIDRGFIDSQNAHATLQHAAKTGDIEWYRDISSLVDTLIGTDPSLIVDISALALKSSVASVIELIESGRGLDYISPSALYNIDSPELFTTVISSCMYCVDFRFISGLTVEDFTWVSNKYASKRFVRRQGDLIVPRVMTWLTNLPHASDTVTPVIDLLTQTLTPDNIQYMIDSLPSQHYPNILMYMCPIPSESFKGYHNCSVKSVRSQQKPRIFHVQ